MATFSYTPQWVYTYDTNHNVIVSNFESGREQRRYKGAKPRKWHLVFRGPQATIDNIVTFFNARKGSYESFTWTPPGETTAITARFEESSLSTEYRGTVYAECELVIQEVLE